MAKYYDRAWNPIFGCKGNFAGCEHCYAKSLMKRRDNNWKDFTEIKLNKNQYIKTFENYPQLINVCSQSDLFQNDVKDKIRDGIFRKCNHYHYNNYLFITKFSTNMKTYFNTNDRIKILNNNHINDFNFDNMMFGVSVCNKNDINKIQELKDTTLIKHRFVAFEPVLEDISSDISLELLNGIEWAIIGCETGENADNCDIDWLISLINKINELKIPVFVNSININNKITAEFDEMPDILQRNDNPFSIN